MQKTSSNNEHKLNKSGGGHYLNAPKGEKSPKMMQAEQDFFGKNPLVIQSGKQPVGVTKTTAVKIPPVAPRSPVAKRSPIGKSSSSKPGKHHSHGMITYEVNFRVKYNAAPGMKVIVVGSIPELDDWKKQGPHKHNLRRNGDVWESERPLITRTYFFHYKYAVVKDNYLQGWERGVDRVGDLENMVPSHKAGSTFNPCDYFFGMIDEETDSYYGQTKPIQFNETWEKLWVSFMVYHQALDPSDQLLFSCEKVGIHKKPMKMMSRDFKWMNPKYGTSLRPWEIHVEFDNKESEEGQFKSGADSGFQYTFSVRSRYNPEVTERAPMRWIDLQNPNKYRGVLGSTNSCLWLNTDRVWNVNGAVFKADGNFLNHFFFQRIGETPISVGSYPQNQMDYGRLRQAGTTAVLNIMDAVDHRMHSLSPDEMSRMCSMGGLQHYYHAPVSDVHLEVYCQTAFKAVLQLHKLVNEQNHDVFINCGAGVSRSSTIWIAFIALFGLNASEEREIRDPKGIFKPNAIVYKNVEGLVADLAQYLQTYHGMAMPNLEAVHAIIEKNKDYVEEQRRRLAAEEARRRKLQEEKDRLAALKKAQEDAENARRIRLAEAEQERIRVQRWEQAKQERDRRDQLELDELERQNRRKIAEEEERLRQKQLAYDRSLEELRRRFAEEEHAREAERKRLQQEALLQEEKVRLQKLAIEAARDAARIKKEQEAMEETERKRRAAIAKDEADRLRRERELEEEEERRRKRLLGEELERKHLEEIRNSSNQAEQLKIEIQAQEEQQLLMRRKIADEEDSQLEAERQAAREEAARLTERLKQIDIESGLAGKKKQIKDWTMFQAQARLEKIKQKPVIESSYRMTRKEIAQPSYQYEEAAVGGGAMPYDYETPAGLDYNMLEKVTPDEDPYDFTMEELVGLTEEELDSQAQDLFQSTPISFLPRKGNKLDDKIQDQIERYDLTIPIVHIMDKIYLVGANRMTVDLVNDVLLVRKGNSSELRPFEDYIVNNQKIFQRQLVMHMIRSGESLEYVVDKIISGQKIKNIHKEEAEKAALRKRMQAEQRRSASYKTTSIERVSKKVVTSSIAKKSVAPIAKAKFVDQSAIPMATQYTEGQDGTLDLDDV